MSTTGPIDAPGAGTHLLADFWGGRTIASVGELDSLVRSAVDNAGATLLDLAFHQFPTNQFPTNVTHRDTSRADMDAGAGSDHSGAGGSPGGITGYALLAESHISVHTWPERDYVAIDVFMCGEQRPEAALEVMRRALAPTKERVRTVTRGVEREAVETLPASERCASARPASGPIASEIVTSELSASRVPASGRSSPGIPAPGIPASGPPASGPPVSRLSANGSPPGAGSE